MKRTVLSAGLISAMLLFSTSAISSNNAPNSGDDDVSANFGFLKRTPASLGPHYFTVRVTAETFSRQFSTDAIQSFGVNVYWKTKGYDQDKGRNNLSVTAPNLPRCPFKEERQCDNGRDKLRGNSEASSEHLEGLLYSYLEIDNGIYIQGKVPDKLQRATRFFRHRYGGYEYPPANKQDEVDDPNVRLSAIFFSQSEAPCEKAGSRFCGGQDGHQVPKDILISSNDLEYLVIEVIGFQHTNKGMFKKDAFYTYPIAAVKYVPTGQGKKMKILRSDRHAKPGMGMEMFAATFPSSPPNNETDGYWDFGATSIHGDATEIDFTNIDILKVKLFYNSQYPDYDIPEQTGIYFQLEKTDLKCFPWVNAKCIYPLN